MTRLIVIRHGETNWNVEGRYQGQADPRLNQRGLKQACALVDDLRGVGLNVLYSSPLQRASQTALTLALELGVDLRHDRRLMEINQGEWEGRRRSRLEQLYPGLLKKWEADPWSVSPPGGETVSQVQARIHAALDDILAMYAGRCIGLVTHRVPIVLVKMRYQGLGPEALGTLDLPNAYWEVIDIRTQDQT
jgi:phosphoserine phosphatase